MSDGCCNDDLLTGPARTPAARALGVDGFAALWRGERPLVADLTDDAATVDTLSSAGRLEVDNHGRLVGVHGLVARPTAHRIDHAGGRVHTWCALDAIGIPAALGIDAIATITSPACGAELPVVLRAGAPADAAEYRLWLPGGDCGHLVDDFCRRANLYCSALHLESEVPPGSPGQAVTVTEAASIGRTTWQDVSAIVQEDRT